MGLFGPNSQKEFGFQLGKQKERIDFIRLTNNPANADNGARGWVISAGSDVRFSVTVYDTWTPGAAFNQDLLNSSKYTAYPMDIINELWYRVQFLAYFNTFKEVLHLQATIGSPDQLLLDVIFQPEGIYPVTPYIDFQSERVIVGDQKLYKINIRQNGGSLVTNKIDFHVYSDVQLLSPFVASSSWGKVNITKEHYPLGFISGYGQLTNLKDICAIHAEFMPDRFLLPAMSMDSQQYSNTYLDGSTPKNYLAVLYKPDDLNTAL